MKNNFLISGAGGQGVISLGIILSNIFMHDDKFVSFTPCYGAEMRGGAVNCEVNMSDSELLCLQNDKIDYVIALNQTSFDKFLPRVRKNGTIIVNSSMTNAIKTREDINYVFAPLSEKALELNNQKLTNSIALGILSSIMNGFNIMYVKNAFEAALKNKKELVQENIEAYKLGYSYLKKGV